MDELNKKPNSNVNYIEPNYTASYGSGDRLVEVAPDLSDMCVAMNLEVEVFGRSREFVQGSGNEVKILQWRSTGGKSTVSFMEGKKIYEKKTKEGSLDEPRYVKSLTTDYTDVYFRDVINYGTNEMVGIKSVNVSYEKFQIPQVTVVFTDVRGIGLFQPTELRKKSNFDGIKGMSEEDVAQSFFQCFFTMPYPKFTFYMKGVYGEPVCYDMSCSDFRTNFNASTGSFDMTVRFIGYMFSFLSDISFNALLAAPFSDYYGQKYWEDNVANGRFFIYRKGVNVKQDMPTLMDIYHDAAMIESNINDYEHKKSSSANAQIDDINLKFSNVQSLYNKLYAMLLGRNGRDNNKFRIIGTSGASSFKILVMRNDVPSSSDNDDSSVGFENIVFGNANDSNDYKELLDSINSAFYDLNNTLGKEGTLVNPLSYSTRPNSDIINVQHNNQERTVPYNPNIPTFEIAREFSFTINDEAAAGLSLSEDDEMILEKWLNERFYYKRYDLNGPEPDYRIMSYLISCDYTSVIERVDRYNSEISTDVTKDEIDEIIDSNLSWYPSIENFTRCVVAHFETLMYMMYNCVNEINKSKRKISDTDLKPFNLPDLAELNGNGNDFIPPFPRFTKEVNYDNGVRNIEDAWIGDVRCGTSGMREKDLVNGLLNGADMVINRIAQTNDEIASRENALAMENSSIGSVMKNFITPYDPYLKENPYNGTSMSTDVAEIIGKIAVRMSAVLRHSWKGTYDMFLNDAAVADAENFYLMNPTRSAALTRLLGYGNENAIDGKFFYDLITNSTNSQNTGVQTLIKGNLPWYDASGRRPLIDSSNGQVVAFTGINDNKTWYAVPCGRFNFDSDYRAGIVNAYNNGQMYDDSFIMYNKQSPNLTYEKYKSHDNLVDGMRLIIDDRALYVHDIIGSAINNGESTRITDMFSGAVFSGNVVTTYESLILKDETRCFRKSFIVPTNSTRRASKYGTVSEYTDSKGEKQKRYEKDELEGATEYQKYISEIEDRSTDRTSGFKVYDGYSITTIYGVRKDKDKKTLSLTANENYDEFPTSESDLRNAANLLMGIRAVDYDKILGLIDKNLDNANTFTFLPRIALLQIGCLANAMNKILTNGMRTSDVLGLVRQIIPVDAFENQQAFLSDDKISYQNTLRLIQILIDYHDRNLIYFYRIVKYYEDFANYSKGNLQGFMTYDDNGSEYYRASYGGGGQNEYYNYYLKEGSEGNKWLTSQLMSPVLITLGYRSNATVKEDHIIAYFNRFVDRLKELYQTNQTNDAVSITMASESQNTSDDIRIAMYKYLKIFYDKWIPTNDFATWRLEEFFGNDYEKSKGHNFFFIDSYYNKIGHLPLNVRYIKDKIEQSFGSNNFVTNFMTFLNDVYSKHNCNVLFVQSFVDMTDPDKMKSMFTPLPFNSINGIKKFPDFVVLYPYEADSHANLADSSFKSTSFMLNDDEETPMPIRERKFPDNDQKKDAEAYNGFRVPAFGVSYGSQYQSYFKNINVGMENPMVTEQALKAKYAIIDPRSNESRARVSSVGQDLFDVYSNTSYTCEVEMMGCAWVQPLMYFVLLNIPMFRGSYLIQKVTHDMAPGTMTTRITGVRMARVSNTIVKKPYNGSTEVSKIASMRRNFEIEHASVDNDCRYEEFPVGAVAGQDMTGVLKTKLGQDPLYIKGSHYIGDKQSELENCELGDALSRLIIHEDASSQLAIACEALTLYNRYIKGTTQEVFTVAQWAGWKDITMNEDTGTVQQILYNVWSNPLKVLDYRSYNGEVGCANVDTNKYNKVRYKKMNKEISGLVYTQSLENKAKVSITPEMLAKVWFAGNPNDYSNQSPLANKRNVLFIEGATIYASEYRNGKERTEFWNASDEQKEKAANSLPSDLYNAINKSAQSSPASRGDYKGTIVNAKKMITITKNGSTGSLGHVFDIILNTPNYFRHVAELTWVVESVNNPDPLKIIVKTQLNSSTHQVTIQEKNGNYIGDISDLKLNEIFAKAMVKKCGGNPLTVANSERTFPFITAAKKNKNDYIKNQFDKFKIEKCNELVDKAITRCNIEENTSGGNYPPLRSSLIEKFFDTYRYTTNKTIVSATSSDSMSKNPESRSRCAQAVRLGLNFGFGNDSVAKAKAGPVVPPEGSQSAKDYGSSLMKAGFVCLGQDSTNDKSISVSYSSRQYGDVIIFNQFTGHEDGHAAIWLGPQRGWQCDYNASINSTNDKPNRMGLFNESKDTAIYTIYRYPNIV